ncbi:putative two-component response regulator [Vibrio orientalis CIP 102891 = ATCC 33934]|uniref:Putative two-component response regulator n=1 Tax=Vibrio orientalis CIP 102891 = ATCC 33934 TaxID=675816 RepID=C9QEV2_VIBOR|nr:EAL domain-containing response regulator [Vibrio orientalis]EEX94662.1 response regulator VieA [Vibrio orientalis CIP 102891 = ATCC 33934]EGU51359.1 putative two-component response regulator [Vibrio orientalis CIP 102891 = ATCC 33934]
MYNNVLLIDDSNIDREVTSVYLNDLGADTVQHAKNGEIASRILATETFELIICDVDMPVCDGLDFLRKLASIDKSVPILMISSIAQGFSQSVVLMANQLGFKHVNFLQKPFCIDTLEETLQSLKLSESIKPTGLDDDFQLHDLLTALYRNQIVNYYQKKVATESEKTVGYEVLSRFEHPIQGTIPAARFLTDELPTSFYCQLFLLSLEKAIRYWKRNGTDVSFSINAPPDIFVNPGMVNSIIDLVESFDFDFDQIIIEITEGRSYLLDSAFLYAFNKLSLVGVKFSIDDFGDDHATFRKLANLSFHELKISRQLLLAGNEDEKTYALIKNIVSVCRELNIQTVAEGVENHDLLRLAQELKFDICQGFLLGKPSPQIERSN